MAKGTKHSAAEQWRESPELLRAVTNLRRAFGNLSAYAQKERSSLGHAAARAMVSLLKHLVAGNETELRRMCDGPKRSDQLRQLVSECKGILETGWLRFDGRPGWGLTLSARLGSAPFGGRAVEVAQAKDARIEEALMHALQFVPLIVPYALPRVPSFVDTDEVDAWVEQCRHWRELAQRAARELQNERSLVAKLPSGRRVVTVDEYSVVRKALTTYGMTLDAANNMLKAQTRKKTRARKTRTISKTSQLPPEI